MKFSYNWLQKYFDQKLPEANILANQIGLHSFELEGIDEIDINGEKDFVIDWDILPNRSSDCLCYMGMAKEIGAVLNLKAKEFIEEGILEKNFSQNIKTSDFLSLKVADENLVKRATKRYAQNVKVGESPQWLKDFLEVMGQKSINNVVDITNYVMWVTGQPVHAFDYDKLAGEENYKNIEIKFAQDGEKIIDLSGDEHELDSSILVISDGKKPLDIAGIKGGMSSGVDENTTRLVLSAVNFEYENIRNTSKKLKLQTDASKRFENEVPLIKVEKAMALMSYLLEKYADAEIAEEYIDTNPNFKREKKILASVSKINSLLGLEISKEEIFDVLERLGIEILREEEDEFEVLVPEDRLDLNIWQDLAEEVGRIFGYQNIEDKFPEEEFNLPVKNKVEEIKWKISDLLVQNNFYEVSNRSIVKDGVVKLANSLNSKATSLRPSLLPLLKEKVEKNFQHSLEPRFFEISKIFKGLEGNGVVEEWSFAGIIGRKKIKEKIKEDLFYTTKGILEKLFNFLRVKNLKWKAISEDDFVAKIESEKGEEIGKVGVNFWEISLEKLIDEIDESIFYQKPSKFPKIERDVSFWVSEGEEVSKVEEIFDALELKNLVEREIFDIYKDKENNRKSFAFKFVFQSDKETLSDEFANQEMEKVYQALKEAGYEIR